MMPERATLRRWDLPTETHQHGDGSFQRTATVEGLACDAGLGGNSCPRAELTEQNENEVGGRPPKKWEDQSHCPEWRERRDPRPLA